MSRAVGLRGMPSPPIIVMGGRLSIGQQLRNHNAPPGSGISPWSDAADTVIAYPFVLEVPTTIYKVFWVNGSAAGGNSDVAIYDENYKFIVGTGAATAGSGNNLPQAVALSATTTLPPGLYYCGMGHNATTTNQVTRYSVATTGIALLMALGCWKFADAVPINLDATPADLTNVAMPVFGLITRSVFDA